MTQHLVSPKAADLRAATRAVSQSLSLEVAAAFALCVTAAVHIADVADKLEETTYIGIGFILGPIAAALLAAVLLVTGSPAFGWLLGSLVSAGTAAGYVLSRTTGLPGSSDDIGNWGEPIGVLSLVSEGAVVALLLIAAVLGRASSQSARSSSTDVTTAAINLRATDETRSPSG